MSVFSLLASFPSVWDPEIQDLPRNMSYHYPSSKPQKNASLNMRKQPLTNDGLDELVKNLVPKPWSGGMKGR